MDTPAPQPPLQVCCAGCEWEQVLIVTHNIHRCRVRIQTSTSREDVGGRMVMAIVVEARRTKTEEDKVTRGVSNRHMELMPKVMVP